MSENVTITNLLIATWDAVGYYFHNSDKVCTHNDIHIRNYALVSSSQTTAFFLLYWAYFSLPNVKEK